MTLRIAIGGWVCGALVALGPGCILEDNPSFGGGTDSAGTDSTSGPSGSDTTPTTTGQETESSASATTTGTSMTAGTDTTDSDTEGTTGGPDPIPEQGCNEPECPEIHVGLEATDCDRMEGGAEVVDCDYTGPWAVRTAVAEAEFVDGARIYLHDRNGLPSTFVAGLNVPGHTSILAADDVPHDHLLLVWDSDPTDLAFNVRMLGDDIHLRGFTLITEGGGESAISFRADPATAGTETAGHLVENIEMIGSTPEDVGGNSIVQVFQHIGQDTTIRNTRAWGFYEGTMPLAAARGLRFHNNTIAYYQSGGGQVFDASGTDDIEVSNNVFLSLTNEMASVVQADAASQDLTVVGNVVEGFGAVVVGAQVGAPDVTIDNNSLGEAPLEAPHFPRFLSDATIVADPAATVGGTSLDGVELAAAAELLPGSLQERSGFSGPRRTTVTVGSGQCGAVQCDVDLSLENATQLAVWLTWPGGTVEMHPGTHSGAEISWPIELHGTAYDTVILERDPQGFLETFDFFERHTSVLKVDHGMDAPVVISDITIDAGPDEEGLTIEGSDTNAPPTPHLVERVRVRDRGNTDADLADIGFWIGHNVILRDSLVIGGFQVCVRHGVRGSSASETPSTTNWVYNLTCRQTKTVAGQPLAAFDVASVIASEWFNIAVEMAEPGVLFRAQRRVSSTNPNLDIGPIALDPPTSFNATAWVYRNWLSDYDGYTDLEGTYVLTNVDEVLVAEPFFVGAADSHLDVGAAGLDSGVDPGTIDASLTPGTDFDGNSRTAAVIDRGAYEQGL